MNPPSNMATTVSVVIVSFNTVDKLRRCLGCIETHHEIIVVDNGSTDGSTEMVRTEFPYVQLIENRENLGFGAANNRGAESATSPWILYLNSDAYAERGAIDRLVEYAAANGAVAAGGRLLNLDGSLQHSVARPLTLGMVFWEQSMLEKAFPRYWVTPIGTEPVPVDQVMGACLMVRRGLEAFDERFFLYCEDTDLCARLKTHGPIFYVPGAHFVHELGASSHDNQWKGVARYNLGKELYFELHQSIGARYACWILDRIGALLRLAFWLVRAAFSWSEFRQVSLFWRVLTAQSKSLDPRR